MSTLDPTESAAPQSRTETLHTRRRTLVVGLLLGAALVGLAILISNLSADVRAVKDLSPADQATFVRAECEALRTLCVARDNAALCVERAGLLRELEGLDPECRKLVETLTAPTR